MAQHKKKKPDSSLTRRSQSSLYPEYSSSLKIVPMLIAQQTRYFCSSRYVLATPCVPTPHRHGNTQNTSVPSLTTKKVSFSYLQEPIILCKPSHAHVLSTRLPTMYFFTLQVSSELPLLSHNLNTACLRFWLHFLNHLFFIVPSISLKFYPHHFIYTSTNHNTC